MHDLIYPQQQPLQQMLPLSHFKDEKTEFMEAKAYFLKVAE